MRRLLRQILHRIRAVRVSGVQKRMLETATPLAISPAVALVIAPHHDDETFGCGGLIALKRKAGVDVHVVVVTDGRASHGSLTGEALEALLQQRREEALRATSVLGVAAACVHFLNYPDAELPVLPQSQRDEAVNRLADLIIRVKAQEIFVCKHDDRHPDHEATFTLTRDALAFSRSSARLFEYPVWVWWLYPLRKSYPRERSGSAFKLDIASVRELKDQATAVYRTQHQVLPPAFMRQFASDYELFFLSGPSNL